MDVPGRERRTDPLLVPFLEAAGEAERQRQLTRIVSGHLEPIVAGIIERRLRPAGRADGQDTADLRNETVMRLLARLSLLRTDPADKPIQDLRGYAAVVAHHACDEYVRRKYPQRWRVKNRLRYILTHAVGIALWEHNGELVAGQADWKGRSPAGSSKLSQLRANVRAVTDGLTPAADPDGGNLAAFLTALFRWLGHPIALDDLVGIAVNAWGVQEPVAPEPSHDPRAASLDARPDPRPGADVELEWREHLRRLWREIRELPPRQRHALLLNLRDRDGGDVLELLPLTGVAGIREIAATLAMQARDLAALWRDLPMDDAAIAGRLGVTRQQVINLRKCARERIARRMQMTGF